MFIPKQATAQNNDGVAAAAAGIMTLGLATAAALQQIQESLEQTAVEYVLSKYPEFDNFKLSTSSLNGTKFKDLSLVDLVTFEILNNETNNRYILFAFTSNGWHNEYGVDFSKLKWKIFDRKSWDLMMIDYIKTASGVELSLVDVARSKIVNLGVKQGSKFILKFEEIDDDTYLTSDYSDEFKIVFNENSLGLYLKETFDLVQISRSAIIKAHDFLN